MRLYLETTIFNYFFDTERDGHDDVVQLFEAIRAGKHEAYTSEYTAAELDDAAEPKRSKMLALIERELNEIRIKHYEQTKNMTDSERTAYYKAKAERALKSYGIKVVPLQSARRAD